MVSARMAMHGNINATTLGRGYEVWGESNHKGVTLNTSIITTLTLVGALLCNYGGQAEGC